MRIVKTCPRTGERISMPVPPDYRRWAMENRGRAGKRNDDPEIPASKLKLQNQDYRTRPGIQCNEFPKRKTNNEKPVDEKPVIIDMKWITSLTSGKTSKDMYAKRKFDMDTMSTWEIRKIRNEELAKKKSKTSKEKVDMEELTPMTSSAMIKFILDAKSTTEMLTKHMRIQSFQKVDEEDLILFELHGYAKFDERNMFKSLLDRTIGRVGPGFIEKMVNYAAQFCLDQYRLVHCKPWSHLLTIRHEHDWPALFQKCIKSSPELELALLVTLITLIPEQRSKHIPKIFSLMAKNDDIPNCYVWLSKIMVKNYGSTLPDKNDMEICTRRYLDKVYEHVKPLTAKNSDTNVLTEAQRQFALISNELLGEALKIVNEKDQDTMKNLISNPRCEIAETPCNLFIEYLVQFVKLGMFSFSNGDKLIAWHYYYDDRWMGYDRPDLFGTNFVLHDQYVYTESFKYKKKANMEHPHMMDLTLATRAFDWMSKDEELYKTLMEKFGDEDMIQLFVISLAFCGFFDHIIKLYEQYKDEMKTNEGFMCLHMCYLFACAKKTGMLQEAVITWARIVQNATKWNYLACIAFRERTFPLPSFVRVKFAGQFATRILRNCLWEAAIAEGEEGWKKYGLLILLICESLEDSFLNHQMVRVLLQKIPKENWTTILQPGFEKCVRRGETFNHIMTKVYIEYEELIAELREQEFLPEMISFPKDMPTPGYLKIVQLLREKDPVVSSIVDWIPEELLIEEIIEVVPEEIKEDVDETSMDSSIGKPENTSRENTETPEYEYSPTKHGEMSRSNSFSGYSPYEYEGNGRIGDMSPNRVYNDEDPNRVYGEEEPNRSYGEDEPKSDSFSDDIEPVFDDHDQAEPIVIKEEPME